jgi:hypothetical protein
MRDGAPLLLLPYVESPKLRGVAYGDGEDATALATATGGAE